MRRMLGESKQYGKRFVRAVSRKVWREPLTRSATVDLLSPFIISRNPPQQIHVPHLDPFGSSGRSSFTSMELDLDPDYVWLLRTGSHGIDRIQICRSGTVLINGRRLLSLDFGSSSGLVDWPVRRRDMTLEFVIAPWSHTWASYYDYVIGVVTKLCRMKWVLHREEWQKARICYPLLGTRFEREFLHKLGIGEDALVDTRTFGSRILTESAIVGNNQNWYEASPRNLALLRDQFLPESTRNGRLLFIPRRQNRRIRNEAEVRRLVTGYGFEILEDEDRSLDEQIGVFSEATAVVGPHGAGLTNIIWSRPGTKVLEFFHRGYRPPYYYYLSQALGLDYSYIVDESAASNHWTNKTKDITVDVSRLDSALESLLDGGASK